MSKTWYPVINYEICTQCGACTNKCKHGVYDLKELPKPVVIIPENCIQGCHGCGNLCEAKAISYVGDFEEQGGTYSCSCETKDGGCC